MPRFVPSTLPNAGARPQPKQAGDAPQNVHQELAPSMVVIATCDIVRDEHGRRGIGAFLAAVEPFLPRALIEQAAAHFHVDVPPCSAPVREEPEKPAKREAPPIPPELLLQLLGGNAGGGGTGGIDPMMLLKLMQNG